MFERLEARTLLSAHAVPFAPPAHVSAGAAVCGPFKPTAGTAVAVPGDLNGDGKVDTLDLNILAAGWQTQYDAFTLNLIASHWQEGVVASPPPTIYDWHTTVVGGIENIWAPNPSDLGATWTATSLYGPGGVPLITDIHQGQTPDCYLLAAEGALALDRPSLIEADVVPDAGGGFAVTFHGNIVIHTDAQLSLSLQAPATDGAAWWQIIEKAYCALKHNPDGSPINTMASIGFGYAGDAMGALGESNTWVGITGLAELQDWAIIVRDVQQGLPIAYHTSADAPTMVQSHVYVITGFYTDFSTGIDYVQTYNPWGFYDTRTITDLLANTAGGLVVGV